MPTPPPADVIVRTTNDFQFVDSEVSVSLGGKVVWVSNSFMTHSITPVGHDAWVAAEGSGNGNTILSVTFTEPGLYLYHCIYHAGSGMTGFISVEP